MLLAKILYNSVLYGVVFCVLYGSLVAAVEIFVKLLLSDDVNEGNGKKIAFKRQTK